jgi:hypothetical protein
MSRPSDDTTVAELTNLGVDAVDAFCEKCGNLWRAPIAFLPPATTLAKIEALMACPVCGGIQVETAPVSVGTPRAGN